MLDEAEKACQGLVIKGCIHNILFSSQLMNRPNKLECFFPVRLFQPSLMFVGTARSSP
jgi:hypothetical protein